MQEHIRLPWTGQSMQERTLPRALCKQKHVLQPGEGTCAIDQWHLKNLTAISASDSKYIMMNPSRSAVNSLNQVIFNSWFKKICWGCRQQRQLSEIRLLRVKLTMLFFRLRRYNLCTLTPCKTLEVMCPPGQGPRGGWLRFCVVILIF